MELLDCTKGLQAWDAVCRGGECLLTTLQQQVGGLRGGGGGPSCWCGSNVWDIARVQMLSPPTLPIAESTTQGYWSGKLHTMDATSSMRSALATDDPPNFITTVT